MSNFTPYDSPHSPQFNDPKRYSGAQPAVVVWYKVYVAVMTLIYLGLVAIGILLIVFSGEMGNGDADPVEAMIMGGIYAAMGFLFAIAFGVGLFLPRAKWGWIYAIVLIALGLTSCCTLPACIPLLIFWLKPEVKEYHGMQP